MKSKRQRNVRRGYWKMYLKAMEIKENLLSRKQGLSIGQPKLTEEEEEELRTITVYTDTLWEEFYKLTQQKNEKPQRYF